MRTVMAVLALGTTVAIASPANAACTLGKVLELPVTMVGFQPMVTATIDGHETRFVADSGAFYSTISPGTAAEFALRMSAAPNGFRLGGIGGSSDVRVATVKTMALGGHSFERVQFLVGGSETGGAGLLGQNILGFADTEYDLAGGVIRLMKAHDCEHASLAYWAEGKPVSQLAIESATAAGNHTKGIVTLDGAKIAAYFDTGAGTTILTTAAAARAGVRPDSPGVVAAGYSSGLGRKRIRTWIGTFKSLSIGDEQIQKIRLRFGDIGDTDFEMLIGADFFLSHRVYVDNGRHRLFFTYNGGPVFDLKTRMPAPETNSAGTAAPPADAAKLLPTTTTAASPAPTGSAMTAEEFARRGAAETTRRDYAGALADLDRATALAPDDAGYRYQHALVLIDSNRGPAARAELDRALTLKPGFVDALMLRATLRLRANDRPGAKADLDAVSTTVAKPADVRFDLAGRYEAIGEETAAIEQLDPWIAAHPDDNRLPEALNSRCWARTLANVAIDEAIADCSRSLRLRPKIASTFDSRGLAYLRHGDLDRAAKDFDTALAMNPKMAWSLYGRGIVHVRQGQKAEGEADIAAAVGIRPAITRMAERFQIKP